MNFSHFFRKMGNRYRPSWVSLYHTSEIQALIFGQLQGGYMQKKLPHPFGCDSSGVANVSEIPI
ncbi:MAG TPA: hypothetical protein DD632_04355, partial [Oribacterium sp.]|nr:hypothetical protein [Oribacterium sp.]